MASSLKEIRILRDIKSFIKSDLNDHGIFCSIDESNIDTIKALIIGPKKTPYENGFYFFEIMFPNDYPYNPPKVKFMTLNSEVRFNPNLYTDGKVCLSILGTWHGPGWSSALTLNSVLLSIQSLLNENPIQNEPGYENEVGSKSKNYNKLIEYYNIKVATIDMIKKPPYGYEDFKETMNKHFLENIEFYKKYIEKNKKNNNNVVHSPTYGMNAKLNIEGLNETINDLYKTLNINSDNNENHSNTFQNKNQNQNSSDTNKSKMKTKKCPNEKANLYDIGFIKKSENDDNNYIVIQASGSKRTFKKWKIYKD